jgi:hypothetical protein
MAISKTAKAALGDKGASGKRMHNGKEVRPVLYVGRQVGHGKYIAGSVDGALILDQKGIPVRFSRIGASS